MSVEDGFLGYVSSELHVQQRLGTGNNHGCEILGACWIKHGCNLMIS